jgi:hypothetical protein
VDLGVVRIVKADIPEQRAGQRRWRQRPGAQARCARATRGSASASRAAPRGGWRLQSAQSRVLRRPVAEAQPGIGLVLGEGAIGKKRTIAEAAINELKELATRKILDFAKALADRGAAVGTVADNGARAAAAAAEATKDWQAKQSAYAALEDQPKLLAAKLKDLRAFVDEVARAEMHDDSVAMYFCVGKAATLAKVISIPPGAGYTKQLIALQADTDAPKAAPDAKKADAEKPTRRRRRRRTRPRSLHAVRICSKSCTTSKFRRQRSGVAGLEFLGHRAKESSVKIVIVSSIPLFREGLASSLASIEPDAPSVTALYRGPPAEHPDAAIVDVRRGHRAW